LLTDWSVKKQMEPEDAAKYAYDNNYSCFNYSTKEKNVIFFYKLPYNYCKSLVFQDRYYDDTSLTVLIRRLK